MDKDLENPLKDCGLLGTIGGGYKSRVWLVGDGSDVAAAYLNPIANELTKVTGDRVVATNQGPGPEKLIQIVLDEYDPLTMTRLGEAEKALGADSRPFCDLVHFVITGHQEIPSMPDVKAVEKLLVAKGIGVVVTHLETLGSIAEMRQIKQGLWPQVCDLPTTVTITFQHLDDLVYGTRVKDRGRAVLSGWGVLPAPAGGYKPLERSSPDPRIGLFVEPELTNQKVGYLVAALELAAKAGWDVLLIAPGISDAATRAIEKLLVEDGLATNVDILDQDLGQEQIVHALASCEATVWLPDGERALGQDWRVALGAAARRPLLLTPNPRTVGFREDPQAAIAFCWADTGMEEIASTLHGMDPTTPDGQGPYEVWQKRVETYADGASWEKRAEETLVAYAKAMEIVEERRMQRVLQNFPKRR